MENSDDKKYKDVIFKGSTFPDAPYRYDLKVSLTPEMKAEYLPVIEGMGLTRGMKLLCTVMAHKEGFYGNTRSRRTNNPGNIGNTDSGINKSLPTLADGIRLQIGYINDMVAGRLMAYPIGKRKLIKPYYSKEIARNRNTYGISPYLPGYDFIFTGQLDQFVKIYSTGARAGNGYINIILSYFKANGLPVSPETTIGDIILMQ